MLWRRFRSRCDTDIETGYSRSALVRMRTLRSRLASSSGTSRKIGGIGGSAISRITANTIVNRCNWRNPIRRIVIIGAIRATPRCRTVRIHAALTARITVSVGIADTFVKVASSIPRKAAASRLSTAWLLEPNRNTDGRTRLQLSSAKRTNPAHTDARERGLHVLDSSRPAMLPRLVCSRVPSTSQQFSFWLPPESS
jgi:hypothetical protein